MFVHFTCHDSRVYIGYKPIVIISDLDMLKEVFVKQFSSLTNRQVRVTLSADVSALE